MQTESLRPDNKNDGDSGGDERAAEAHLKRQFSRR
jgi:hypothetical protein